MDFRFKFLHFFCVRRVAAECIAVGEARVGKEVFVVVVVVDARGRDHARQDGEGAERHGRVRGVQFTQITDEGFNFSGRLCGFTCCEQAAVKELVDGEDGGVARLEIFAKPLLRILRFARHCIVVLHFVGQYVDFRARDFGGVEHELAAWRPAVERHEHDAPGCFPCGVERCAAVGGAQDYVVAKDRAERKDEQAQQSLFQESSS